MVRAHSNGCIGLLAMTLAIGLSSAAFAAGQTQTAQGGTTVAPGLVLPAMDPVAGRKLFASKGCVVCHSINGVGGTDAPKLDAATMPAAMNPFEFSAKMWRGAMPMIAMQQHELGQQIEFNGQELANIVAFVHNAEAQKSFSEADIPANIKKLMSEDEDQGESKGKMGPGMMGGKGMMGGQGTMGGQGMMGGKGMMTTPQKKQ